MDSGPFGISEADSAVLLDAFESSGLFRESRQLLEGLRDISKVVSMAPGWEVLVQGETNDRLYVLLHGSVHIYVDGELVAHLRRKGDFIGEMGVITGLPNSATVVTESECEFLCIDIENKKGLSDSLIKQSLYGLFARALANKLVITNERAKKFERTSEDLRLAHDALRESNLLLERKVEERTLALVQKGEELETQNAELAASMGKLEELVLHKDTTFSSLDSLCRDDLEPLRSLLREHGSGPASASETRRVEARIGDVLDHLRPMTELYEAEVALRNKRVLLAESNKKLQRIAKIALLGTGVDLEILDAGSDLELLEKPFDVVMTDAAHLDTVVAAHEKNPDLQVVFMTPNGVEAYLDQVRQHDFLSNIVACNLDDQVFTTKNILTTISKILNRDIFGLEKYLLWGVDVEQHTVQDSAQRKDLIDAMADHFANFGIRKRLIARVTLVCEELLMNALYDAAVDENGRALFNHLSRRESVVLPGKDVAELRYACDGTLIAMSVSDPYGSLKRDTIIDYLASCYEGRAGELNKPGERGGAGRGLHQIVETSDLVVFNVRNGLRTEVIALFNLGTASTAVATQPSFQFFTA